MTNKSLPQIVTLVEEELPQKYINYEAQSSIDSGSTTNGDDISLTDTSKSWTVDEHINKIVKINCADGVTFDYGLVASNTSTKLVFDHVLSIPTTENCTYVIIDTLVLDSQYPMIVAFDVRTYDCGLILPTVSSEVERKKIHLYIEKSTNGVHKVPIVCRGTDTILNKKYVTLEHQYEGVTLYLHTWITNHFDVLSTYRILRLATGYTNDNTPITDTDWTVISSNLIVDKYKRFIPLVRSGNTYIHYTSLITSIFEVEFTANIRKTGGAGGQEADITVAKRLLDGTLVYYDTRTSTSRFGTGEGVQTISVKIPVELSYGEEIVPVARITSGNIVLETGSQITIREF